MKFESELVTSAPLDPAAQRRAWLLAAVVTTFVMLWLFVWYKETVFSAVAIWMRSETFAHGFLIFPISAYLIWTRRRSVLALRPEPSYWPLLLLLGTGFIWLLGGLADVIVVQQYSLALMIPIVVWSILGGKIAWELVFPLLFLLFAVPFGEIFLPPLMAFTADFTVAALQLTGIPVYREGLFFTIPSGQWSVVEACSGLRYLIASLTLGCLYAYLTYRSPWRRLLFVAFSVIVPIVANGLRAYMIVMIGHFSDMRLAVGVDHYIYGWVFFGVVMLLLFWIGSFWREDHKAIGRTHQPIVSPASGFSHRGLLLATALVMISSAVWPIYAAYLMGSGRTLPSVALAMPFPASDWRQSEQEFTDWAPHFVNPRAELSRLYVKGEHQAGLYIGYYKRQHQGSELIASQNTILTTTNQRWGKVSEQPRSASSGLGTISVTQTQLRGANARLLVWHWFWVEGRYVSNPYLAKFLEAKSKLLGKGDDAAVIVVYTPYQEDLATPTAVLRDFVTSLAPAIDAALNNANHD